MSLLPHTARGVTAFAGLRASSTAVTRQQALPFASFLLRRAYGSSSSSSSNLTATSAPAAPSSLLARRSMTTSAQRSLGGQATTSKVPTNAMTEDEALTLLNEQRSIRPNSPHLTIYQPQLTWYLSVLTRITGVGLSGLFYVWAMSYLAIPYTGAGQVLSSAHLVQYAAMTPFWLKMAIKVPAAAAFSFHSLNGLRHLLWDVGYGLSMKGVYKGGYLVMGLTALSTIGLCML